MQSDSAILKKIHGWIFSGQSYAGLEGQLVKNCIHAIFNHEFSVKTHLFFTLTNDAPSLALLVLHLLSRNPGFRNEHEYAKFQAKPVAQRGVRSD
ncbi:MAG TPA: hypothetical protein DCZ76_09375 [Treponema sp.]|nr:hypothetical protein [Treponema sp.]